MFEAYTKGMKEKLVPRAQFSPFPVYEDRKAWEDLAPEHRERLIRDGEKYLGYTWPATPATVYMEFYRNGNRSRYEDILFNGRRTPLVTLVVAECCEGKGRFIDDIINGLWSTMEETTWVLPAHNPQFVKTNLPHPLPDTEDPDSVYIDLFSARCAALIAWIHYVLGNRLMQEAPQVPERMLGELHRRIIYPFLLHKEFGWMGYHGQPVNNWNPWILSNVLTVAGLACMDEDERTAMVEKAMECLECFVKFYAPDGGCDEGPGYWNVAGSSLFDCLDILCDLTGGRVNLLQEELVHNICAYVYKMHISGKYFVNYADASAIIYHDGVQIYRMGKCTGDKNLVRMGVAAHRMALAVHEVDPKEVPLSLDITCTYRMVKKLFTEKKLMKERDTDFPLVRDVWFPGIQVMAARMEEGSDKGLYLSAKGGNNGESHNHNDVGSFVLYCDGKPAVIDVGTGVYEKKTFSDQRYEILQMQSLYHNLPMVGGVGQLPGREYAARDAAYTCEKTRAVLTENLCGMYPEEAGVESWQRTFVFDRKEENVTVTDDFVLREEKDVAFALMTPVRPTFTDSRMTITLDRSTQVTADFDPNLVPEVEVFDTGSDASLRHSWGEHAYRTLFRVPGTVKEGCSSMTFRKK